MLFTVNSFAQFPFYEAFDNNNQKWAFIGDASTDYSMEIVNGHLALQSRNTNAIQTFKYVGFKGEKDFEINFRMVFLGGDDTDLCAVRWGMSDDGKQYYVFGYADKGQYYVGKHDGTKLRSMANFYPAPSVKPKDYNLLQVKKMGEEYFFKINGVQVYQAKKMPWFSDGLAIKCPASSRMMVDYISITDPAKDKELSNKINDILFGGTTPAKNLPKSKPVKQVEQVVVALPISGSAEFKEFMQSFVQMDFPHKIHPREKKLKGTEITGLSFTKQLFKDTPAGNTVFALAKVADCADGFILLLASREKNPQAENTDYSLHKVSSGGVILGSQKIGRVEFMNNRHFLTTDMDFYKKGNTVTISIDRYFDSEHKQNNSITFNQNFCTF
ncbi:MAG: hypothetical protein H7Y07_18345 [Pyrinomonadaceae bacterium]|nr:hypothetical protein [Sphingobacteriaceae bacterium]